MRRTRVKICGITRPEHARAAARAGADAIGLMFYAPSPRYVAPDRAREICAALPPLVSVVGVFVNPEPHHVETVVEGLPVDLLQFHGEESPELCAGAGKPYVKAVRVRTGADIAQAAARYPGARALLLDAHHDALWGGTGTRFDWDVVPQDVGCPVVLAGGLTPENVAGAIRRVRPFAVDVSGGVESAPGEKDVRSMERFMKEVISA
ncbi:MAG: phosphoribosylanthranilate isomerase [Thiotrichales bacterium]|nr:phosphoribosylanthranilate isomerase [Thiotrichales bacterium]MCY4286275.1 phosphoribosylanthranilate isomerase [Thiotrichales bacterium]MCY4351408.1 phosphoribosylanthranilate isomerase [Thiotrichales bacterium]